MDCVEEHNEVCEFNKHEDSKSENLDSEKESRPSHAILRRENSLDIESNDNRGLIRHDLESASLEYAQKYANRIKSFLGFEMDVDKFQDVNDSDNFSEKDFNKDAAVIKCDFPNNTLRAKEDKNDSDLYLDRQNLKIPLKNSDIHKESETDGKRLDCASQPRIKDVESKGVPRKADKDNEESISLNSLSVSKFDSASPIISRSPEGNSIENTCSETKLKESSNLKGSNRFDNSPDNKINKHPNSENFRFHTHAKNDDKMEEERNEILVTDLNTGEAEKQMHQDFAYKSELSDHNESSLSSVDIEEYKLEDKINSENVPENSENFKYLDLNETDLLEKSIKKPHMDVIRRLSKDIVREVIESARNSVHESYANKCIEEEIHKENCDHRKIAIVNNGDGELEKDSVTFHLNTSSKDYGNFQNQFTDSKSSSISTSNVQHHEKSFEDEETICGLGCFKPKCIQKYAAPKVFLLFFAILGVLNGAYYSYCVSIISTLEKKYAFKSKVSGILLLADEITPLILGIFVGYFGGKCHRPRMIAFGMLCAAASCFISGLPHLIYRSDKHFVPTGLKNETGPEFCYTETKIESCSTSDRPPTTSVVGIFLLSSFLKGIGTLLYLVIGISHLDDVIKRKNSPFYFGISLALRLLGPLVGYLMSSAFLKIYENPFDDPGFGTDDPRWIGAWWMGFFLQGVLLLIFTVPIALFPRRLPGQKRLEKPPTTPQKENIRETLAGLLSALKRLAKNPIFIIVIINTTMKIFGHLGHSIMLPKYMENQFRLSAADASLFSGATSIFCIMIATIFGGFMIWKFRPRIKLLLAGMVVSEVMLCIGFLILMIPRCQPADLTQFGMNDEGVILNSVCNENCDCSKTSFTPFCGPDGKTTYFSPCYAGCTAELTPLLSSKKQKEFGNCSCLNHITNSSDLKITEGFCPDDNCWSQAVAYLVILFLLLTLSNTFTVAHTMILLRSVHPTDKSVALGTFETCICLFGFIPFPVTFGALVDSACLIWEESCGETGNCWFYDMDRFAFLLHGAAAIFCSMSVVCLISIYVLSSQIKNLYEEEQEEEEEQNIDNIKLDTTSGSVTAL